MAHMRTQIRAAIQTALSDLSTVPASRVFRGRVRKLEETDLDAILIQAGPELIDPKSIGAPRIQDRTFQVDIVICVASTTDDLDDRIDAIAAEVEVRLAMPGALRSLHIKSIALRNIDRPTLSQSTTPVGQAALAYAVNYLTAENAPDTPR